jgi:hypothetical protein
VLRNKPKCVNPPSGTARSDLPPSFFLQEELQGGPADEEQGFRKREQIIALLKEHEAEAKTSDRARKRGISETTMYNWKTKYGGVDVSEAGRLKVAGR